MRRAVLTLGVGLGVLGLAGTAAARKPHEPPVVTIEASGECAYYGLASGKLPVTIHLYQGTTAAGIEVAQQTVRVRKHKWSSTLMQPQGGPYTAVATEPGRHAGTPEGQSEQRVCEIHS
ncbi:MAG TPA: hypothetical protein VMB51_00130 [Solirubrobacteraceae bacterium]|nr:hypothetical protein [Solirubrobacteraceae bacterium]